MKPLNIYHADKDNSITKIELSRIWHNVGNFEEGPGFYFAFNKDDILSYGHNIYTGQVDLSKLYHSRNELLTIKKDCIRVLKLLKKESPTFYEMFQDYGFDISSNRDISLNLINNLYDLNKYSEIRNFQMNLLDYIPIEDFVKAWLITGKIGNLNNERKIVNIFDLSFNIEKIS